MKTTDLEDNKTEIIEILTSLFGDQNLNSSMIILKDKVEYSEIFDPSTTLEEILKDMELTCNFEDTKMKLADYVSSLNNNDSKTYSFNWMNKN